MKRKFLVLIPIFLFIGFAAGFSARAAITCPTASPQGVGCASEPSQLYYCASSCRSMEATYCPTNELTPVSPCSALDSCGVCSSCIANHLLCTASAYPTRSCVYNDPANHCATLVNSNCNAGQCATCVSGYTRCATNNTCVLTKTCESWETYNACTDSCEGSAPTLKLDYDSGSLTAGATVKQSLLSPPTFIINPSKNIGIGTTIPGAKLEVVPSSGYAILAGTSSDMTYKIGNVASPTFDTDAATKAYVDSALGGGSGLNVGYWGLDGSNLFASSTSWNVGIGITNPGSNKLKVVGNSAFNGIVSIDRGLDSNVTNLSISAGTAHTNVFQYSTDFPNSNVILDARNNWNLTFQTNDNEKMRIASGGNVGIGTTAPLGKLHINGGTGSLSTGLVFGDGDSGIFQMGDNQIDFSVGGTRVLRFDSAGFDFANNNWAKMMREVPSATNPVFVPGGINDADTGLGWASANVLSLIAGGLNGLNVNGSGNVGIGTTTPTAGLEVTKAVSSYTIKAGSQRIGDVASPVLDADAATKGYVDSTLAGGSGLTVGYWGLNGSNLYASSTSWNVGIGTTAPAGKLDVNGTLITRGYLSLYSQEVGKTDWRITLNNVNSDLPRIYNYNETGASFESIQFGGFSEGNGLIVTGAGRVGIGTTNPNSLLEVFNNSSNYALTLSANDLTARPGIRQIALRPNAAGIAFNMFEGYIGDSITNITRSGVIGVLGTVALAPATSTVQYMYFGSETTAGYSDNTLRLYPNKKAYFDGNVGIGTTAPDQLLSLSAAFSSSPTGNIRFVKSGTNTTNGGSYIQFDSSTSATARGNYNARIEGLRSAAANGSSNLLFFTTYAASSTVAQERLRISDLGRVGIGTTAPMAQLEVSASSGYSILAGNQKIGNVSIPTAASDVATMGWVESVLAPVAFASYTTSTPVTYSGSQGGYTGGNALCNAVEAGSHVCTADEILYTINSGNSSSIPANSTLWISNGPPGYTANANDCQGWTSSASIDYGAVWVKLATGDGFGALNRCNLVYKFACCK